MRITKLEARTIRNTVHKYDPSASVYLFGSRTDDSKRGGDIDILIISSRLDLMDSVRIEMDIENILGETDMDIVIKRDVEDTYFESLTGKFDRDCDYLVDRIFRHTIAECRRQYLRG